MRYDFNEVPYKIRYLELNSNDIFNFLQPNEKQIEGQNKRNRFFEKLERSILQEGIRNPIVCWALKKDKEDKAFVYYDFWCKTQRFAKHRFPEKYNKDKLIVCRTHGGSRLMIAQKYNMKVPCLLLDYCEAFPEVKVLDNMNDILDKYQDKPEEIFLGNLGLAVIHLPHIHLNIK